MEDEEDFLVPGLISSASTLLFGEPKAGKSFLASALIKSLATGTDFLGRPVPQDREFSTAICWTDDMAVKEYKHRIRSVMPEKQTPRAGFYQMPIMRTHQLWSDLYEHVLEQKHNFVLIDNLSQALDGSANADDAIREFFNGVRLFTRAGLPVLVIGHSTEKPSMYGGKSKNPIGHTFISAAVRHKVFVGRSRNGNMKLTMTGAAAEEWEMTLKHGAGARFDVLGIKTAETIKNEADSNERQRTKQKLDTAGALAVWVVDNCQGLSQRKAAEKRAAITGKSAAAEETNIRRAPCKGVEGKWELTG